MLWTVRPYIDSRTVTGMYHTLFYPHIIYGTKLCGHASESAIKPVIVLQKADLWLILNSKTGNNVTSNFKTLKIMSIKMKFEYRILKLPSKIYNCEEISGIRPKHMQLTRQKQISKPTKSNNMRGGRSLLGTGIKLFNRYLQGQVTGLKMGPLTGLADCLWDFNGW